MTLAVVLKLNLLIFALAIAIVWVFDVIRTRSVKSLICFVLAAACVLGLKAHAAAHMRRARARISATAYR